MRVGIINKSNHPNPEYKTSGSSGVDIRANINEKIILGSMERIAVPTGLYLELPKNIEAQIRPRSGLALKHGITVLNTPGTIDSDYRGEISVVLINLSDSAFEIKSGERIAQLIISRVEKVSWKNINILTNTQRGGGGFGSTGKN